MRLKELSEKLRQCAIRVSNQVASHCGVGILIIASQLHVGSFFVALSFFFIKNKNYACNVSISFLFIVSLVPVLLWNILEGISLVITVLFGTHRTSHFSIKLYEFHPNCIQCSRFGHSRGQISETSFHVTQLAMIETEIMWLNFVV
jgi:hypothetical protein